jgi:hypothetical protein
MTHIAIQEQLGGKTVDWMEKVGDEQYQEVKITSDMTRKPHPHSFGDEIMKDEFLQLDKYVIIFRENWCNWTLRQDNSRKSNCYR